MNLRDEIKTIDDFAEVSNVINKSNFIAQVYQVNFENQVKEYLANAKKKYYEASHHCYAFKLADGTNRHSDAGEPNGTAGLRILNAIEHFNLSNQLIIVSRIFGGVKLGVGPLGKAYYESAYNVIYKSKITEKYLFQKATISATFDQIGFVHRILANHKSLITKTEYREFVELSCFLKSSEIDSISKKILELGKSTVSIIIHSETVYK
jgi:uncharacterized YigZ family protein